MELGYSFGFWGYEVTTRNEKVGAKIANCVDRVQPEVDYGMSSILCKLAAFLCFSGFLLSECWMFMSDWRWSSCRTFSDGKHNNITGKSIPPMREGICETPWWSYSWVRSIQTRIRTGGICQITSEITDVKLENRFILYHVYSSYPGIRIIFGSTRYVFFLTTAGYNNSRLAPPQQNL